MPAWTESVHAMGRVGAAWTRLLADLFLPPHCVRCQQALPRCHGGAMLCRQCCAALGPVDWPRCRRCGHTLAQTAETCPWCRYYKLQFDAAFCLGEYRDALRDTVLRLKQPTSECLARAVGALLARRYYRELSDFDPHFIVPIPMHWLRRTSRGGNDADWLARAIRGEYPHARVVYFLSRQRNTLPQRDLGIKERFLNMRSAFGLRAGYDLQGARVLLVDDILTTGATCSSAADVLKRAGASRVAVAVVGRAEGPDSR